MLIFDSYDEVSYGGTGKSFDLSLLKGLIEIPFLVAGGIDETNFHNALLIKNCSGIDISSCHLYTSADADHYLRVDLGGRRISK